MQISHGNEDWRVGKEPLRAKCVTQVRRNKKKIRVVPQFWLFTGGCTLRLHTRSTVQRVVVNRISV